MGRAFAIVIFLLILQHAFAGRDTTLTLVKERTIMGGFAGFTTDNLGNIFLIAANNQIKKLNKDFDSAGVFNDVRRYGDVFKLDVNNPLKIVVYYRDFTTIVVLDRFLNIRNSIDLRNAGILQAKAVTQSYDNNYWVFDELNSRIKKIDDNGVVLSESTDFRILFNYEFIPQEIIDADGALYLYDAKKGWLIFDYYGAYKKHIDETGWKDVTVTRGKLSGRISNIFYTIDQQTFSITKTSVGEGFTDAVKVQQYLDKLFVLSKQGLSVYNIR